MEYFNPSGFCLDPCRGAGAFYDALPEPRDWCEIEQGRDFLTYEPAQTISWAITNPPWSAKEYRPIAQRCFGLADNVVFLVRLHNGLGTTARHNDYRKVGHRIKEIILCPWEGVGFAPEGFSLAVIHWQKGWQGDSKWTYWPELASEPAPTTTFSSPLNKGGRSDSLVIRPRTQIFEPAHDLIVGDSALKLKELVADSVDLTVTSPPYDGLRTYGLSRPEAINHKPLHERERPAKRAFNYNFDFETIARELWRVTKRGGVVVWVVGDQTRDFTESGTSFRQVLFFKEIGFNLYDTMIYESEKPPLTHRRYEQKFEFMFVLSKGNPKTFNPLMEPCTNAGQVQTRRTVRNTDGQLGGFQQPQPIKATKIRGNIWTYDTGARAGEDKIAHLHPAIFPSKLAEDHILSWSNPGDTVLDPFLGSGTTGKMAIKHGRRFIGIDVSAEYVEIARKRIGEAASAQRPARKIGLIKSIIINEHFLPRIAQDQDRRKGRL